MAKTEKLKEFFIDATVEVMTNTTVLAASLEEAMAIAKECKISKFVEILGDHNDSRLQINGVFAANSNLPAR